MNYRKLRARIANQLVEDTREDHCNWQPTDVDGFTASCDWRNCKVRARPGFASVYPDTVSHELRMELTWWQSVRLSEAINDFWRRREHRRREAAAETIAARLSGRKA